MENIRGKLRYNRVRLVDVVPIGNEEYESNAIEYNHALAKLYLVPANNCPCKSSDNASINVESLS